MARVLADAEAGDIPRADANVSSIDALLAERNVHVTTWDDWQALDRAEKSRGASAGRTRTKITDVREMLRIIEEARTGEPIEAPR